MRKLILMLGFLMMMYGVCFADVTATIIGVDKDDNGNIRIKTQYKLDGVEVESRYPPQDGKYYWVTRYNLQNFANMTKPQIKNRVKQDLKSFGENLIIKKFMAINNDVFVQQGQDIINVTNSIPNASIYVDGNQDGVVDTKWTVFSNGTRTEEPYTPPTP